MKQPQHFLFIVTILFFISFLANAQGQAKKSVFNIRAMGMDVGTITVNQLINGDKTVVEAISEVEVRIVFKIKVKYIQTSTYVKGILQESLLKTYKKDEINSTTSLIKKGNGYTLNKDGEISYVNDIIKYSGSLLYFHEPTNVKDLYFEINGKKTTVQTLKAHEYLITDPHNGNKNEYTYKNGVLKNAIIKHTMANVYLDLKEDKQQATYPN
jgi:hypothetical protein